MRAVRFHDHHDARLDGVTAGPTGALAVLAARDAGASRIEPREDDDPLAVAAAEAGAAVDIHLEHVGSEVSLNACVEAARRGGKVVEVGLRVKPATIDALLRAQKDIGVEARWCFRVQTWPRIVSMIEADLYPAEKVVTAEIAADNIVWEGFERLLDPAGSHLRILVRV